MDDPRRPRQNEPLYSGNTRYTQDSVTRHSYSTSSADRYRPALLNVSPSSGRRVQRTPTSAAATVSAAGSNSSGATTSGNYGYYSDAASFSPGLQSSTMQYQTGYGTDQRQQSFTATFTPNLMYNVHQEPSQNTIYESPQHFPSRPASLQLLGNTASYFSGDSTTTATSALPPHASGSSTVYQPGSTDRSSLLQGYSSALSVGSIAPAAGTADVTMDDADYARTNLDDAYTQYQTALKDTFSNIKGGMLVEASQSLLELSDWLLSHVGDLGLTMDSVELHGDRIRLWNEFNHAWLAIFQSQKEMTLDMMEKNQQPRHPQSMIPYGFVEKMAKELMRLCDGIEKHGLVDYQYGVWEEYIMTALTECLDLLDEGEGRRSDAGPSTLR